VERLGSRAEGLSTQSQAEADMLQTDIADHNHLCSAALTRNQMYGRFGNCKTVGEEVQEFLVGRSIHGSCRQSNAYQVSVDTRKLSVRSTEYNLQPYPGPAGYFMNRWW
jgi:hypothetical protein